MAVTPSILTMGFRSLAYRDDDGAVDGPSLLFGIAFLGLSALSAAALVTLVKVSTRTDTVGVLRWAKSIAVLLLVGIAGAWLCLGIGRNDSQFELHSGVFWLSGGGLLFAVLIMTPAAQAWWVRARPGHEG